MQVDWRSCVPLLPPILIPVGAILFLIVSPTLTHAGPVKGANPVFETDVKADDADANDGPPCRLPTAAGPQDCADNDTTANTRPKDFQTLAVLTTAWPGKNVAPNDQAVAVANSKVHSTFQIAKQGNYSFTVTTRSDVLSKGGEGKVTVMAHVATPAAPPNKPEETVKGSAVSITYDFVRDPANPKKIDVTIDGPKGKKTETIDNPDVFKDVQQNPKPFVIPPGNYLLRFELNTISTAKPETRQMTNPASEVDLQ
jgi:hypothetical protein